MEKKVALALGSGGARGIAHIGVIKELLNNGFSITSISGTSMGALVGGVYAAGKLDEFEDWITQLNKKDVFSLMDFTISKNGIIKANKSLLEIQKFIPDQSIENLPIKYSAIATDIKENKEIVITQGSLFEAIRASIAIPMVLTPFKQNGNLMVDGGILNPVPTNRVYRQKNDILIAVDVTADISNNNKSKEKQQNIIEKLLNFKPLNLETDNNNDNLGYINLASKATHIMMSQITKLTLELFPPDFLVEIPSDTCGTFEFYKSLELINLGKNTMARCLEQQHFFHNPQTQ
jgi:NTE family protein